MTPRALVLACAVSLVATPAAAHPAPFSFLDLSLSSRGVEGALVLHDFDVAHDLGVDPPERFRDPAFAESYRAAIERLMERRLTLWLDASPAPLVWTGFEVLPERQSVRATFRAAATPPGRVRLRAILFPYDPVHQTFVNVYEDGQLRHQAIVSDASPGTEYFAGTWQGTLAVLGVFLPAGVEHILIGPDHVLFLVGLMLLGGGPWRLVTIVTAFTLGHSITLSIAALDVWSPPAHVVEPAIALSIVFVGADNLLVHRRTANRGVGAPDRPPRDIRAWVAGAFGLVHGFGFASVLKAFGLPLAALGWSLFSFNLGVELGQLAIVLTVSLALAALWRRQPRLAHSLVLAGSALVMAAGAYWFVDRVFIAPPA